MNYEECIKKFAENSLKQAALKGARSKILSEHKKSKLSIQKDVDSWLSSNGVSCIVCGDSYLRKNIYIFQEST